jgi:two-component system LytT family sensor kinase
MCVSPSPIVQPLIENAVKLGIATNANPAQIRLRASSDGDWLVLDVSDNGLCTGGKSRRGNGIGFANVHERLLRRFGDCCKFEAGRTMPPGIHVHMKMPLSFAP